MLVFSVCVLVHTSGVGVLRVCAVNIVVGKQWCRLHTMTISCVGGCVSCVVV